MSHPQIAAFARLADGDAKATRAIAGQNSMITRTIHDFDYNPITDEIVVPQFYAQAIMTYPGGANGDEKPKRIIMGDKTEITTPSELALDAIHKEVFIPLEDEILVFRSDAEGNVAPIRVLKGPDTMLGASHLTVDPVNNLLIVAGSRPRARGERGGGSGAAVGVSSGSGGQILIFDRTADGDAKPLRAIYGPHTEFNRAGLVRVYPPTKYILLGAPSNDKSSPDNFVGVWSENDNGDVPPHWTIGGPNELLRQVRGITIIPKAKDIVVSDKYVNAVMTYHFPEIF